MKTQISNLRSGAKNQILNPNIEYNTNATSHIGHSGTNTIEVQSVWNKITNENPNTIKIKIKDTTLELKANWSLSRKSVHYSTDITKEILLDKFLLEPSKKYKPTINILNANNIIISNGKNISKNICPSLIEILL